MVLQTVAERFVEGRRLGFRDLRELLVESPELRDSVWAQLSVRHFTRRRLREGIEQLPELRVELGRLLLAREPRVADLLEVLAEVPELRGLALEALAGNEFSPRQVMRLARRNPRLRGAVLEAVLSRDRSRKVVEEVLERVPESEALTLEVLDRLGVPAAEVSALVAAVPALEAARPPRGSAGGTAAVTGEAGVPSGSEDRPTSDRWFEASEAEAGAGGEPVKEAEAPPVATGGSVARALDAAADVVAAGDSRDVMAWVRAAQREPDLVQAAVDVVLGEGVTRERVVALSRWLPGSERSIARYLGRLGLDQRTIAELAEAMPDLVEALDAEPE